MSAFNIVMPKLGESVIEATITRWLKKPGDRVNEDDALVEIATDKVDSEVPSPVEGVIEKILFEENSVVPVGKVIAVIKTEGENDEPVQVEIAADAPLNEIVEPVVADEEPRQKAEKSTDMRFYSPLVKNMIRTEHITDEELAAVTGSGENGRVTRADIEKLLLQRNSQMVKSTPVETAKPELVLHGGDEIIQMDRMRKLIAEHMVHSKQVSPHVTSFIEVDMGKVVAERESRKAAFEKKYGTRLTYTHIIMHAAARALREYPLVNASVDGDKIIVRRNIHLGMATALPNGNLIVPVVKNADMLNIAGLARSVNDLAQRARENKLSPDEISGGTFTFTNLGSFGSLTGTPIINQPQVAILAAGAITKKPVVIERPEGDSIGIRPMMILSLSYDHRIVDGALGGLYILKVKEILENFTLSE